MDLAPRESQTSWRDFFLKLKERDLRGVEFVVSNDHVGLKKAIAEVLTEAAWLIQGSAKYPKLTNWVDEHIGETLTFYRLPRAHHKHFKSTNLLKRLNEEIKRRTRVVRISPGTESCLRLVRALRVEPHEPWLEDNRYLNMDLLDEQRRERLRQAT